MDHAPSGVDESESPVARAIATAQVLLEASVSSSDEQLADALDDVDHRALEKVRFFLAALVDHGATCSLVTGSPRFSFRNEEEVQISLTRIGGNNIRETEETLDVVFSGVLPHRGWCEFQEIGTDKWISAKIDAAVTDPQAIRDHPDQPAKARFLVRVTGQGKPRYTLLNDPSWEA